MHDLALMVINDGNGDQCGRSYTQRVEKLKTERSLYHIIGYWQTRVLTAMAWLRKRDKTYKEPKPSQLLKAAYEVAEYYENHLKELGES